MADQSGVPVWIIRVVALVLALGHAPLVIIGYFVAAWFIRREAQYTRGVPSVGGGVPDRFADLDRRMAEAEMAAWREEYRRSRS